MKNADFVMRIWADSLLGLCIVNFILKMESVLFLESLTDISLIALVGKLLHSETTVLLIKNSQTLCQTLGKKFMKH